MIFITPHHFPVNLVVSSLTDYQIIYYTTGKMMKRLNFICILLGITMVVSIPQMLIAEENKKITTLPMIRVVGEQTEELMNKELMEKEFTTNSISPDAKIEAGETNDITDLLKESQSILIENSSYGKKVFLRGMEDQNMRILINGMPVGQMGKYYARSFEWETIPADAIEKIEVTKGTGSAEYGNTLAGTINIITKKGGKKLKTQFKTSYGRFEDRKYSITNSGSYRQFDWFAGGSYHKKNEYLENNDIEDSNGFLNVGVDLGNLGKIKFSGYKYHKNEGYVLDDQVAWNVWSEARNYAPGSSFTLDNTGGEIVYLSELIDLGVSYGNQKRNSNPEKNTWNNGDTSDYKSDFNTPAVKLKVHHSFGSHALSFGGEYTYGDAGADWEYYNQGKEHIDFNQNLSGAFIEDSWNVFPKINFTYGIRYDEFRNKIKNSDPVFEDKISDHQWSPRYTLTYKPADDLSVYFTGGRIFKAPTMADQYRWYSNYNFISFSGRAVLRAYYGINQPPGAPAAIIPDQYKNAWQSLIGELKPVKGWDYEIGVQQTTNKFTYHANLFYQDIDNYIETFPVSYPPTYNVDSMYIRGIELSGKYVFSDRFEVEGNYTYEETEKHGDKLIEKLYSNEKDLANTPKHLFNLTFRAKPFKGFTAEWQSRYTGKRFAGGAPAVPPQMTAVKTEYQPMTYLGGYTVHNLRLSYKTGFIHGVDTKFLFAIENISNVKVWERLDYPNPGTVVYGGVQFEF